MKIALVGNQNSGKTTLFNALTGMNQKIGNWPGVTIERKEGILKGSDDITVVDLPGIYSLSPYTSEEDVSRRFILDEKPDLIINILDATSLERSLYLSTQILELDCDVILALNMADILESHGISINIEKLEEKLGVDIVSISAKKKTGIDELIDLIISKTYRKRKQIKIYPKEIEDTIKDFSSDLNIDNKRFVSVKLIEQDKGYRSFLNPSQKEKINKLENDFAMDSEQLIASKRYDFIEALKKECFSKKEHKETITDKLDRIFLNKYLALPIFAVVMAFVYFLSIGIVGGFMTPLIEVFFNGASPEEAVEFNILFTKLEASIDFIGLSPLVSNWLTSINASPWAVSLVCDGVIAGVGSILTFVPQIIIMFICLSILETTGYMSRIAFFLDRIFHKFGLSGKSLIPFIVGTGCSVPGIMSCRIVEDQNERDTSIILTPFMPCSAKLPVIALFSSAFFPETGWIVTLSFYFIAIAIILLFGALFKKFIFKGEHSSFISELPEYKAPSFSYVARDVFDKSFSFIKRAGTIILLCSIVVWFLSSFTFTFTYIDGVHATINDSMLAGIGNCFAWVFYLMLGGNYSWAATVSAIQSLIAKEQVISSMTVIANVSGEDALFAAGSPFAFFNSWSAFAYLTFILFSAPCFGALGAMRKEIGSFKKFAFGVVFQTGIAWILSTAIGLIGWGVTA